ncbi:alpha/beta-type small acid-soluble spore protein [Pontibacillus sp. ALD_SL1]|uniref:alpha/beta-type small acid-soluble spore protein n=1 Tax=Pontibacillus sp. ALD_SL1 TaxID=2777185 RepID=UPI001A9569CD|nr:alpha/beta-type small acid-soluble spore protein [Pontibacillus sp. ALD_SL1]QST01267.1 alpha/beta-type small acid-soluble spore protein [Pontibacillus sp. ALD_SL1]
MARRNKLLVPEARQGLDQLKAQLSKSNDPNEAKYEVAREQGVTLNKGYNGDLTSKEAGKVGGNMGGKMVQELVKMAQQQINDQQKK